MLLTEIQHIIKFIEDNTDKKITTKELEFISNYSYRNLQRIFKRIFNESLGAFQKRIKLENAYKEIIFTNNKIGDIAINVGFESAQSFSKSFKIQFGLNPINARLGKEKLFESYFSQSNTESSDINFEIKYLNPLKVFYKAIQTNNYNNNDIENLWSIVDLKLKNTKDTNYYGIIVDEPLITEKAKCRYEACMDKDPNDDAFYYKTIFGTKYAKFLHIGSYDLI